MKKYLYIISCVVALAVTACTKPIEFTGDVTESQVVMQSKITAGDSIKLRLSWSRFFLDAMPFRMIEDATLTLTVNGTVMPTTVDYSQTEGIYTIGYCPLPGDTLSIVARVPGHEPVGAVTVVPAAPDVSGMSAMQVAQTDVDYYSDLQYVVRFRLDDPEEEANFYAISVRTIMNYIRIDYDSSYITYGSETYYDTTYNYNADSTDSTMVLIEHTIDVRDTVIVFDTIPYEYDASFNCRDYLIIPQSSVVIDAEESYNELYFTDANINGLSHEIQINIPLYNYYESMGYDYDFNVSYRLYDTSSMRIMLEITSFSRDLYLYEQTTSQQEDELTGIISEPVQIHSNIDGGYGIFAARTIKSIEIPVTSPHNP